MVHARREYVILHMVPYMEKSAAVQCSTNASMTASMSETLTVIVNQLLDQMYAAAAAT